MRFKPKKIKVFICTYNDDPVLCKCLDSLISSDLLRHNYEINILNNYDLLELPAEYTDYRVSVMNNECRPDFSTGHLSRNWNQGIIHGFKSVKEPDADYVILLQNDTTVAEKWIERLLQLHEKFSYIVLGDGDALQSMTIDSVKRVGLYDERFCGIAYHESDYMIRQIYLNRDGCSINDYGRNILHNAIYPDRDELTWEDKENDPRYWMYKGLEDILMWMPSGAQRETEHHHKAYKYHGLASAFIRSKWISDDKRFLDLINRDLAPDGQKFKSVENLYYAQRGLSKGWTPGSFEDIHGDPSGWVANLLETGALKCVNPQPIVYPYFELDIGSLYNKCYARYPTEVYEELQQISDEKIGKIHRELLAKKQYFNVPLDISLEKHEIDYISSEVRKNLSRVNLGSGGQSEGVLKFLSQRDVAGSSKQEEGQKLAGIFGNANKNVVKHLASKHDKTIVFATDRSTREKFSDIENIIFIDAKFPLSMLNKNDFLDVVFISPDYLMTIPNLKLRNLFLLDVRRILKPLGILYGTYGHGENSDKPGEIDFLGNEINSPEAPYFELVDPVLMLNEILYAGFAQTMLVSVPGERSDPYRSYMFYKGVKTFPGMDADTNKYYSDLVAVELRSELEVLQTAYNEVLNAKTQD